MKRPKISHSTIIIPARYASVRFPGKPLAQLGDKPLVKWVWERAKEVTESVYIATDDEKIARVVKQFGGEFIMTDPSHQSGTDRCAEAVLAIEKSGGVKNDIIINLQGDEPFIKREQIVALEEAFSEAKTEIATLIREVEPGEEINNPNQPKVVVSTMMKALYFSRSVIPFCRDRDQDEWSSSHHYYKHIGVYAFRRETLLRITALPRSPLEIAESLEQNRWLENEISVKCIKTPFGSRGIDTPADLEEAEKLLFPHNDGN